MLFLVASAVGVASLVTQDLAASVETGSTSAEMDVGFQCLPGDLPTALDVFAQGEMRSTREKGFSSYSSTVCTVRDASICHRNTVLELLQ